MKKNNKFKRLLAILLVVMTTFVFTPATAFEAFAGVGDDLTLNLVDENKTEYVEGEKILVKATGTKSDAWVGLYRVGDVKDDPINGGTGSLRWFYVHSHNGEEVDITSITLAETRKEHISAGEYEIVLFGDGLYGDIRKTINITVTPDPNAAPATPSDELTLKLADESKTTYKIGEAANIIATGTAPGAWVGLYKAGATRNPDQGGVTSYRWYYTADYNGVVVNIFDAAYDSNNWGTVIEGDYELILFGDGGYDNVITTIPISVEGMIDIDESQFSLETEKTEFGYGEDIKVKASGKGINDGAWVGLYTADINDYGNSYLYYYFVRDYDGIATAIQRRTPGPSASGKVPDGRYKLVLFADSGYMFPVKTVEIKVVRDLIMSKVIREPGCVTYGLEYVEYEDGFKEYREIQTLGGHDYADPVHVEGTDTHKSICNRNENHKAKIEKCERADGKVVTAATVSAKGTKEYFCSVCNSKYTVDIPKIKAAPKLATSSFAYTGKNIKPAVNKIYDADGNVIPEDSYTVSYPVLCKNVGSHTATVKFKGEYAGTYKLTYKINPKAVKISKLAKGNDSFKTTWKKSATQVTGYQLIYSTNKDFKNAKYKKVKGTKTVTTTVKKLKNNKKYYVKVRAYKVVKGKTYNSAWSGVWSVKTK